MQSLAALALTSDTYSHSSCTELSLVYLLPQFYFNRIRMNYKSCCSYKKCHLLTFDASYVCTKKKKYALGLYLSKLNPLSAFSIHKWMLFKTTICNELAIVNYTYLICRLAESALLKKKKKKGRTKQIAKHLIHTEYSHTVQIPVLISCYSNSISGFNQHDALNEQV